MRKTKTHFEQVPVKIAKKIAQGEVGEKNKPKKGEAPINDRGRKKEVRSKSQMEDAERQVHAMERDHGTATCRICGKPVPLESCKTDPEGRAVHESCVVRMLIAGAQKSVFAARTRVGEQRRR